MAKIHFNDLDFIKPLKNGVLCHLQIMGEKVGDLDETLIRRDLTTLGVRRCPVPTQNKVRFYKAQDCD